MATYTPSTTGPNNSHTLQEFRSFGNSTGILFDYKNYCLIDSIDGNEIIIHNVIDDYIEDFMDVAIEIKLSKKEQDLYKYNPKMLSLKLYGSTIYHYLILRLNNIANIHEFDLKSGVLYLVSKEVLKDYLGKIYSSEQYTITRYNQAHLLSSSEEKEIKYII